MPSTRSKRTAQQAAPSKAAKAGNAKKKAKAFAKGKEDPTELAEERKEVAEEIEKEEKEAAKEEETEEVKAKEEAKAKKNTPTELERGSIYFFYTPKIGLEEVHKLEDVQRLYILLLPKANASGSTPVSRLIAVPKKQLPDTHRHSRNFGVVVAADADLSKVTEELEKKEYTTKSSGEREIEAARPAGEGVYMLIDFHGNTHLVYCLEAPEEPGKVQHAMKITKEGSYVMSVKNPKNFNSKDLSEYPKGLQEKFSTRSWHPANPPDFLDYKGAELILVGAAEDIVKELGNKGEQLEAERDEAIEDLEKHHESFDKELFKELGMNKREHPSDAILKGTWK